MKRFPKPESHSSQISNHPTPAITSSANDLDSAIHFDLTAIKEMVGDDEDCMLAVIALTRSELVRSSFSLQAHIENKDIKGLNSIGHKLYETTMSVGLLLLSKIAAEFEQMTCFNPEYAEELFSKTKNEIEFVFDLKYH